MHLGSVKHQLRNRTGGSVAEVDHHETWQRARTMACVVTREQARRQLIDEAERSGLTRVGARCRRARVRDAGFAEGAIRLFS